MEASFLSMLRCPRTGGELRLASAKELASLNDCAHSGELRNAAGRELSGVLEGALASSCGHWFYPVQEGIPVLLVEEALQLR